MILSFNMTVAVLDPGSLSFLELVRVWFTRLSVNLEGIFAPEYWLIELCDLNNLYRGQSSCVSLHASCNSQLLNFKVTDVSCKLLHS